MHLFSFNHHSTFVIYQPQFRIKHIYLSIYIYVCMYTNIVCFSISCIFLCTICMYVCLCCACGRNVIVKIWKDFSKNPLLLSLLCDKLAMLFGKRSSSYGDRHTHTHTTNATALAMNSHQRWRHTHTPHVLCKFNFARNTLALFRHATVCYNFLTLIGNEINHYARP